MRASLEQQFAALARGGHDNPFGVLGPHATEKTWVVRAFRPDAERMDLVDEEGGVIAPMSPQGSHGVFQARRPLPMLRYRFRAHRGERSETFEDPYRFGSPLGELDHHLFAEGTHHRLYEKLGARPIKLDGVDGVHFGVWAPNALRVSVVGPFNGWDGRRHVMRRHAGSGVWDIFVPQLGRGALYKFEILGWNGRLLPLKADPFARRMEPPPGNASIVHEDGYLWSDGEWMENRAARTGLDRPVAIYEVHLGSWRRHAEDNRWLDYRELAEQLVPYVVKMGYTHVELLPIAEHPFDGSWGYQPIGLYAPTCRFGPPEDFKHFVDTCHRHGIGVIMDWVPAHFPRDAHGLGYFDGTHLYEHADPRQGSHQDWGTLIFNLGRNEVINYLLANALFWLEHYHIDALRVDAVASMLYLDYSREPGQWVPNRFGGNENLESVAFLRRVNEMVHAHGGVTMAEESTAWPMVSGPVGKGGLGFTYKWNMGWMHDTLGYMGREPAHRRYHQNNLTFSLMYAFTENFVLPLSHDEVVHGKGSILARMPGDTWRKFANVRLYYAYLYGHPGKKLLFMGGEFAQEREWNHDAALDWHLLGVRWHEGVQHLVRDLNRIYTSSPAMYELDCEHTGFEWIDCNDAKQSVVSFVRRARDADDFVLVVCNFTPAVRERYRIGAPAAGNYRVVLNSDDAAYGGSGVIGNTPVRSDPVPTHGRPQSLKLTLPPLAALILQLESEEQLSDAPSIHE